MARHVHRWVAWGSSGVLHAALVVQLAGQSPTPRPPRPIVTTLVELAPRSEPATREPEPVELEPKPQPPPPAQPAPVARPPTSKPPAAARPATEVPTQAPVRLTGLRLSNVSGPGVPVANAAIAGVSRVNEAPAPTPSAARAPAPVSVVPVKELLRKPAPPNLDQALRQHYPPELRRRGIEGQALVRVRLTARGTVSEVALVSESRSGFGRACSDMLRASRWQAGLDQRGRTVDTELSYRCRFQVDF